MLHKITRFPDTKSKHDQLGYNIIALILKTILVNIFTLNLAVAGLNLWASVVSVGVICTFYTALVGIDCIFVNNI